MRETVKKMEKTPAWYYVCYRLEKTWAFVSDREYKISNRFILQDSLQRLVVMTQDSQPTQQDATLSRLGFNDFMFTKYSK